MPAGAEQEDTPKSHRVRSVPLSDQAVVALEGLSRREHFTGPDDLVLGSESGSTSTTTCYAALDNAGLAHLRSKPEPIVWHDLRHALGTVCATKGIELLKIKTWMGHARV